MISLPLKPVGGPVRPVYQHLGVIWKSGEVTKSDAPGLLPSTQTDKRVNK